MRRQSREERNAVEKARRDRYRAAGLCTCCGGPRDTKRLKCSACIERQSVSDAKRIARGHCKICGRPTTGTHRCDVCKQKRREQTANYLAAGLCACGNPRVNGYKSCQKCIERGRSKSQRAKIDVLNAYGGPRCVCCGETEIAFLQLDHINNDGAAHRRMVGKAKMYQWIKRHGYPPGFQVLCANCNFAKGMLGYCPHHPPVH